MATIVLGAVGTAIGGGFGGAILGLSGATIGGMIGSTVGSMVDSWIVSSMMPGQRIEGARMDSLRVTSATEGVVIPRLYGRMRIGGNIIWATDFREETSTTRQGGGKGGGPKVTTTEYSYYASFAVALCEGPITGIGRIWADGKVLDTSAITLRWYPGDEAQGADPFIVAKMGAAQTPAWRGTAYVVFEELLLTEFGNRLPQLSFEVLRPLDDPDTAEGLVEAVTIIPASGEWAYATEIVRRTEGGRSGWGSGGQIVGGTTVAENVHALPGTPDMLVSLDRLEAMVPAVTGASLVVSWFGDDLRAGNCSIRPKVEKAQKSTIPAWEVNGVTRSQAPVVSQDGQGRPVYGGTPADFSVVQAIREMGARGLRVTFYPFLMMDIPAGNTLPDPYSDNAATLGQPVLPWRGRITCSPAAGFAGTVDKTATAAAQVAGFFGNAQPSDFSVDGTTVTWTGAADDWGFRRMILHYAHLCAAAGGVDAFLIGSELRGLTQIRASVSGRSWVFDSSLGGWSLYHATGGVSGGALTLTPNNANPRLLHNAAINMDGREVRYMVIDFERIAARTTGTWLGRILFSTDALALSLARQARFGDSPVGVRTRAVVDMWDLQSGGTAWKDASEIRAIRIDIEEGGPDSSFRFYGIHFTDAVPTYPAVEELRALAADVRAILGPATKISYAADWSEYFGHHPQDGSGDVFFHLDPLWADANIDFVGIDNYMPLSDWRDGWDHLDAQVWPSIHDRAYLQANIAGGEGFDWFYASAADRLSQTRTPITDGAGKPWVFRYKDLRGWWSNPHHDRPSGTEAGSPTAWVPQSKPIRFTELGCPAVDRGTNQPNVFHDPKSSESFFPYFSRGWRDDAIQRAYLEASYLWWGTPANNPVSTEYGGRMVDIANSAAWTWDARPYPFFPELSDVWSDGGNWRLGHWLTGRLGAVSLAALVRHLCLRAGLPEAWVDVSGLTGAVDGYVISALESPRTSITMLARHFGFDAVESEGRIRFVMRGSRPVATIAPDNMVAAQGDVMELTRGQETELPQALKWQVARADEDYDAITVESRRITVDATRVASDSFPVAVPPEEADRRCRRALMEAWIGRETAAFRLPPSRLALDPGDVIALDHDGRRAEMRILSTSDAEARSIEAIRQDRDAYDLPPGTPRAASLTQPVMFGAPLVVILDLPQLTEAHVPHHPLMAAHVAPWPGTMAVWRSPELSGFDLLTTFTTRARIGVLTADLYSGPVSRFDYGNSVHVEMLGGQLENVTDLQLLSGENSIAVEQPGGGWEVLQFGNAELLAPGQYRLSRLLRGQRGTEADMAGVVPAGALVVILDTTLAPLVVSEAELGLPWNWRIGPASRPVSDDSFTALAFTPRGIGLRPFAPVHVEQPWRRARSPGDLTISWKRRDRSLAADSWNAAEIPMSEASESWRVEILDGATVKRSLTASTSSVVYTAAQQSADWGTPLAPGASLDVRIAQIGQAFGAGAAPITTLWF
nr:glycoside hydrolase TIM-barrel-like domain-containing protein [Paracoccus stylophorae]